MAVGGLAGTVNALCASAPFLTRKGAASSIDGRSLPPLSGVGPCPARFGRCPRPEGGAAAAAVAGSSLVT